MDMGRHEVSPPTLCHEDTKIGFRDAKLPPKTMGRQAASSDPTADGFGGDLQLMSHVIDGQPYRRANGSRAGRHDQVSFLFERGF